MASPDALSDSKPDSLAAIPKFSGGIDIADIWPPLLFGGLLLVGFAAILYDCILIFQGFALAIALLMGVTLWGALLVVGIAISREAVEIVHIRHLLSRLSSTYTLCKRFGMDRATLERLAREHNIQPRIIVNENMYYDLRNFEDMNILLRASEQPTAAQDTLLRPAVATEETQAEQLLRAAE